MEPHQQPSRCPACDQAELGRSEQTTDLAVVLDRWEEVLGITFSSAIRDRYTAPERRNIILAKCPVCGFGMYDPPVAGDSDFYDSIETAQYYVEEKWEFLEAIKDLRAAGARTAIDIGCGGGSFLRMLRSAAPDMRLTGNDLNENRTWELAADGFDTVAGSPEEIKQKLPNGTTFDAVCTFQTLEHCSDPFGALAAMRELIRPRGFLIVTTPDSAGPVRHYPDSHTAVPPHHVTLWTERAFRAALPRYGFEVEIVRIEPLEHYLWPYYIRPQWEDGIWPAQIFGPLGQRTGHAHPDQQKQLAIDTLRRLNLKRLHGVPGHTVYVLARRC